MKYRSTVHFLSKNRNTGQKMDKSRDTGKVQPPPLPEHTLCEDSSLVYDTYVYERLLPSNFIYAC